MKIVLDTNVFISGVFFTGPPYQILNAWRSGKLKVILSKEILEEYIRVGEELSRQFSEVDLKPALELIALNATFVLVPKLSAQICSDVDDDKFLSCAVSGNCDFIISGDKHLLQIKEYCGVKILTPRKFFDTYLK